MAIKVTKLKSEKKVGKIGIFHPVNRFSVPRKWMLILLSKL